MFEPSLWCASRNFSVVHAAVRRLENLDEHADHAGGRVELAPALALGVRELLQEVLVHLPEDVAGLRGTVAGEAGRVEQVEQLAEPALVDVVAVVDSRQ
jgi:hypothetical protein